MGRDYELLTEKIQDKYLLQRFLKLFKNVNIPITVLVDWLNTQMKLDESSSEYSELINVITRLDGLRQGRLPTHNNESLATSLTKQELIGKFIVFLDDKLYALKCSLKEATTIINEPEPAKTQGQKRPHDKEKQFETNKRARVDVSNNNTFFGSQTSAERTTTVPDIVETKLSASSNS